MSSMNDSKGISGSIAGIIPPGGTDPKVPSAGTSIASVPPPPPPPAAVSSPSSFVAGLGLLKPRSNDSNGSNNNASTSLQQARGDGYDFCITTLPFFGGPISSMGTSNSAFSRSDVIQLESKWWSTSIVGEIDPFMGNPVREMNQMDISSPDESSKTMSIVERFGSTQPSVRSAAEKAIRQTLAWACHMSIPAVILPTPPSVSSGAAAHGYASVLSTLALQCSAANVQLWIRVPFNASSLAAFDLLHRRADHPSNVGCLLCFGLEHHGPDDLLPTDPSAAAPPPGILSSGIALLHRFVGCNLRAVSFDTSIFLTNKRGYPTLSKTYQMLLMEVLRRVGRTLRVLVEGGARHNPPIPASTDKTAAETAQSNTANGATGCLAYLQYLRHLRQRPEVTNILDTEESHLEVPYLDTLQSPLQPLADDLEFQTYETFERDPVKYRNYQAAIELALKDGLMVKKFDELTQNEKMMSTQHNASGMVGGVSVGSVYKVTIVVVGAGRGPLIRAALAAVADINRGYEVVKPRIIAIEKNPSAVLFLNSLLRHGGSISGGCVGNDVGLGSGGTASCWEEYAHCISIVDRDVRDLTSADVTAILSGTQPIQFGAADIMVSELLGSFGDNELSPECLQGVALTSSSPHSPCLLKHNCISIPQRYVSFAAPISSMRLHSEARAQAYSPISPTDGPGGQPFGALKAMETPYVVRAHAAAQTAVEQPCFEFSHLSREQEMLARHHVGDGTGSSGLQLHQQPDSVTSTMIEGNPQQQHGNTNSSTSPLASSMTDAGGSYNNDRYARLEFPFDPTYGAGCGCGYGKFDAAVAHMASQVIPENDSATGTVDGDNTAMTGGGITIHGFLGTFDALLYYSPPDDRKSSISIAPSTFSEGMFSWFPLYFPLREPLHVPVDSTVVVSIWRRSDGGSSGTCGGRVWYEWSAEVVCQQTSRILSSTPIHNPNGRSYHVRL